MNTRHSNDTLSKLHTGLYGLDAIKALHDMIDILEYGDRKRKNYSNPLWFVSNLADLATGYVPCIGEDGEALLPYYEYYGGLAKDIMEDGLILESARYARKLAEQKALRLRAPIMDRLVKALEDPMDSWRIPFNPFQVEAIRIGLSSLINTYDELSYVHGDNEVMEASKRWKAVKEDFARLLERK